MFHFRSLHSERILQLGEVYYRLFLSVKWYRRLRLDVLHIAVSHPCKEYYINLVEEGFKKKLGHFVQPKVR